MSEGYKAKAEALEAWLKKAREIMVKMELKLSAADKLCEAAREVANDIDIRGGHWGSAARLDRAIAEYEEET